MIANDKPFSQVMFDLCDGPVKRIMAEFLHQKGYDNIVENPHEKAGGDFKEIWDLKAFDSKGNEIRVEGEIKLNWTDDWGSNFWETVPFRYRTIHVPWRKRTKAEVQATHHILISATLTKLVVIPRSIVTTSALEEEVPCKNRKEVEPMFDVDVMHPSVLWFVKQNGIWKLFTRNKL